MPNCIMEIKGADIMVPNSTMRYLTSNETLHFINNYYITDLSFVLPVICVQINASSTILTKVVISDTVSDFLLTHLACKEKSNI